MERRPCPPLALWETAQPQRWPMVFLLLAPINALMVFDRIALIVASPILQSNLHLTLMDLAILVSSVLWTYSLLQIPAGWCVTKFGEKRLMLLALVLWSVSTIATPLAQTFLGLVVLRLLLGLGQAPDWPASVAGVRSSFVLAERSRGTSTILAGQYLGAALAGPVTTMIVAKSNWQAPFYLYGATGLILAMLWIRYYRERRGEGAEPIEASSNISAKLLFDALIRSRQFWCLGGTYACILFVASFITFLMPHYLLDQLHVTYQTMGWLVGIPPIFLWGSVVMAGMIADRILQRTGSVWMARVPLGGLGCILAGCALEATSWMEGFISATACLCLAFFFLGFAQVSLWSAVQDLSKHYTGVLTGWTTAFGNLASAAGPILIAEVVQSTGSWKLGLSLPLGAGFLGALLIWLTKPHIPIPTANAELDEDEDSCGAVDGHPLPTWPVSSGEI